MPYYRCPGCGLTVHSAAAFSAARTCPDCAAPLPKAARVYPTPTGMRQVTRVLAARPEAAAEARRAVRGLAVTAATRETLELLVSELVTNAVLHAGLSPEEPVRVQITALPDQVRIAVTDAGPGFAAPTIDGLAPLAPGGRGCMIVAALSDAWGIDRGPAGCTVWCEVDIDEHPDEAAQRDVIHGYVKHLALQMAAPAHAAQNSSTGGA